MKERFTRKNTDLKARYEAKPVTPKQRKDYIDMARSRDFKILEPYYLPDEENIEEKGDE